MRPVNEKKTCICVANTKGGTGKTTVAFALLAAAQLLGMKAAALDMDSSRGLSKALGIKTTIEPTLLEVLEGKV